SFLERRIRAPHRRDVEPLAKRRLHPLGADRVPNFAEEPRNTAEHDFTGSGARLRRPALTPSFNRAARQRASAS
ncbi:MAG TPA: hypothetical protein PLJ34_11285, partial [Hyphomicrobiales bacterium]|nr:hypothetical protein [Hyphomicrobiales bacterium]